VDKVFIVDDEEWIVENLRISIEWEKYGYEIAGTAFNGIDALNAILECKPQLVFTDIRMAGLNGLELIKKVKTRFPDTQFVIISGFAEFAYAQKAIAYNAVGYLLKPIDENEIVQILCNLRKNKNIAQTENGSEAFISAVTKHDFTDIMDIFKNYGLTLNDNDKMLCILSIGKEQIDLHEVPRKFVCHTGVNRIAYFIRYDQRIDMAEFLKKRTPDSVRGVGLCDPFSDCHFLIESIDQATIAAFEFFIDASTKIHRFSRIAGNAETADAFFKKMYKAVAENSITEIKYLFEEAERQFKIGNMNIVHAYYLNNILYFHDLQHNSNPVDYVASYERLIEKYGCIDRMLEKGITDLLISCDSQEKSGCGCKNDIALSIIKYIDLNYANDISLADISERFDISASYVSQLLKKEFGYNFLEYLTKTRVKNACNLLKSTDLNVNQIAEKSGYDDFLYFRKIFKKVTGRTPTDYRKDCMMK
jgi:two-component system, response regulator YesN